MRDKIKEILEEVFISGDPEFDMEHIAPRIDQALTYLDLFLKVSEGGVKKLELLPETGIINRETNVYNRGFNEARDLCNAHFARKLMGVKEIVRNYFINLEKKMSEQQIAEVDKNGLWSADLISKTFEEISEDLAQSIITELIR